MFGSIIAVLVAVWFYFTAKKKGRQPVSWAIAGLVIFYMVELVWTWFVTPSLKDSAVHTQSSLLVFLTRYAYIAVGLGCAAFFNIKFSGNNDEDDA